MSAALLLRRFWWAPVILGLLFACIAQRATIARKDAKLQHAADVMQINVERINRGVAEAQARDLANARRIETAQTQATQEVSGEYSTNLARAQALAAAYARRLRDQAANGGGGGAGQPGATDTASAVAGAGAVPVMDDDDFRVCTEDAIKAIGWRAWWLKVSAIPR